MRLKKIATLLLSACVLFSAVAEAGTLTPYSGTRPGFKGSSTQPSTNQAGKTNPQNEGTANNSSWKKDDSQNIAYIMNVGLASGVVKASVCMNSQYRIVDSATGKVLATLNGNNIANIGAEVSGLSINGKTEKVQAVRLEPVTALESNVVKYNGTPYRGTLQVKKNGNSLLVINSVFIDEYLMGTVPSEMSPTWNLSALEAQAVAARTFALYNKNQHRADGYDLCAATHCQVYEGVGNESSTTTSAVNSTKGYVMMYNGRPIYAPFHSSSGGMTENCENVWGSNLPYLRAVADDDSQSPFHNWNTTFTAAQLQNRLSANGHDVGNLKSIQVISTAQKGSGSGRVATVKFTGTAGTTSLSGTEIRQVLGLRSTMFSMRIQRSSVNTKVNNGKVTNHATGSAPTALQLTGSPGEQIIIEGHGFGHGLGMSQWGAKAMADKGSKWQDILNHYYTGIEIKKMY